MAEFGQKWPEKIVSKRLIILAIGRILLVMGRKNWACPGNTAAFSQVDRLQEAVDNLGRQLVVSANSSQEIDIGTGKKESIFHFLKLFLHEFKTGVG